MDQLPVAIRLLLAGLIDGPASVFVGATGACKINLAASSPAGELAAPSHKTMSQTTWYQNRGPATFPSTCRSLKPIDAFVGKSDMELSDIHKSPSARPELTNASALVYYKWICRRFNWPVPISKQHSTSGNESRERRNGESIRQDRAPAGAIEIQLTGWFTLF